MADPFNDGQPVNFMEVWDPKLHANVYLNNGLTPGEYIQQHPGNYANYTGAVQHVGNTPVHAGTFTGQRAPEPVQQYRQDYERTRVNPYDRAGFDATQAQVAQTARVLPGARPNYGFLPGMGGIDFRTFMPVDWQDTRVNGQSPDDVERRLMQMGNDRNLNFPTLQSLTWDKGHNPAEAFTGRGFRYGGTQTPEEARLTQDFLGGHPADLNRLAALRGQRVEQVPLGNMQKFGQKYVLPAIMTSVGAIASLGGPLTGAAFGGLTSGALTHFKNPGALVAGVGGGLLGGWGAAQGAQALGWGPAATGAATGAGSGFGSSTARGFATGQFDPGDILRSTAIGGASGYASGATAQTNPQTGAPVPGSAVPSAAFSQPANVIADAISPKRRNPYR